MWSPSLAAVTSGMSLAHCRPSSRPDIQTRLNSSGPIRAKIVHENVHGDRVVSINSCKQMGSTPTAAFGANAPNSARGRRGGRIQEALPTSHGPRRRAKHPTPISGQSHMALLGGKTVPPDGVSVVPHHAAAFGVHDPEVFLRAGRSECEIPSVRP